MGCALLRQFCRTWPVDTPALTCQCERIPAAAWLPKQRACEPVQATYTGSADEAAVAIIGVTVPGTGRVGANLPARMHESRSEGITGTGTFVASSLEGDSIALTCTSSWVCAHGSRTVLPGCPE